MATGSRSTPFEFAKMDKGWLVAAVLMFLFGVSLLWRGEASRFGVDYIAGSQATIVGVSCVIYSTILLVVYIRKR